MTWFCPQPWGSMIISLAHLNVNCKEKIVEMGTDCLHPMEAPAWGDMPLAEAKRRIGCDICIEGNIQMGDVYTCTEEPPGERGSRRAFLGFDTHLRCYSTWRFGRSLTLPSKVRQGGQGSCRAHPPVFSSR